ncbi:MAG TPA: hypothetical protein VF989_11155 [Polyangiaceae bacterium]
MNGTGGSGTTDAGPGGTGTGTTSAGGGPGGGNTGPFPVASCGDVAGEAICGANECGDGVVDNCEFCFGSDGGPVTCSDVSEECDGTTDALCESLGYASGQLGCSTLCTFDERDCESCLGSQHQVRCARPRIEAMQPLGIALASQGDRLAMVRVSTQDTLQFATFSSDLELTTEVPCETVADRFGVTVAPRPGGWVVAFSSGGGDPEVNLWVLDDRGERVEERTIAAAAHPKLVPVEGSTPLLLYANTDNAGSSSADLVAERLSDTGEAEWQVTYAEDALAQEAVGAFADPGFVLGARHVSDEAGAQELIPVDASGTPGTPFVLDTAREVSLVQVGTDRVGALWTDPEGYSFSWHDGSGALLGEPVLLAGQDPIRFSLTRALAAAPDAAIVALAEDTGAEVNLFHVDTSGEVSVPRYTLAREEIGYLVGTGFGDGAVFAWQGDDGRFVLGQVR